MAFLHTLLLTVAAGAQARFGGSFSAGEYAQIARKTGQAQGYVDSDIPTKDAVPGIMDLMQDKGIVETVSARRWKLTERGAAIVFEMSDEHTEDITDLQTFLNET